MENRLSSRLLSLQTLGLAFLILIISYFTYFYGYDKPQAVFWDENYYLASSQKYLNRIFFMHEHPPLGQMLIALGEKLLHGNSVNNQFINSDYAKDIPKEFSLVGYRFFPALCGWLTAPILFLVFLLMCENHLFATLFSCLYVFENALILQSRGAMLDSPLLLFICLMLLSFLLLLRWQNNQVKFLSCGAGMGMSFALAATTKLTGFIMLLLFFMVIIKLWTNRQKIVQFICTFCVSFILVFITVWQIHFSIGITVNPQLKNNGYFTASPVYKILIDQKNAGSILSFPMKFIDSVNYTKQYQVGVPKLNLCKDDENGSPPWMWVVGARSINYRWETPDGKLYSYLYLQVNPMIYLMGLCGVILATGRMLISLFFQINETLKNKELILIFLVLYWSYMLAISRIDRVLYLYHYFPALIFSLCLFVLIFQEISKLGHWELTWKRKIGILSGLSGLIVMSYLFYSPLTYYQPLTDNQFRQRILLPLWDLKCVKCERNNSLFVPQKKSK